MKVNRWRGLVFLISIIGISGYLFSLEKPSIFEVGFGVATGLLLLLGSFERFWSVTRRFVVQYGFLLFLGLTFVSRTPFPVGDDPVAALKSFSFLGGLLVFLGSVGLLVETVNAWTGTNYLRWETDTSEEDSTV